MIERGVWGDGDDRRLLGGLLRAGAAQVVMPADFVALDPSSDSDPSPDSEPDPKYLQMQAI